MGKHVTRVAVSTGSPKGRKVTKFGTQGNVKGTFEFRGQILQRSTIYKISENSKSVKTVEWNIKEKRVQILDHTK